MEINRNEKYTFTGTDPMIISQAKNSAGKRSSILLVNKSPAGQNITISVQYPPTSDNEGVPTAPGGFWGDDEQSGVLPTQEIIYAKADGANAVLSIQERVR